MSIDITLSQQDKMKPVLLLAPNLKSWSGSAIIIKKKKGQEHDRSMTRAWTKNTLRWPALRYPQLNPLQHLADIGLSCAGCISKTLEQRGAIMRAWNLENCTPLAHLQIVYWCKVVMCYTSDVISCLYILNVIGNCQ